jgi:hypothetical protein
MTNDGDGGDTMSQLQGLVRYISELESRLDETESRLGDEARAHQEARRQALDALAARSQLEADVSVQKEACSTLESALLALQNEAPPGLDRTINNQEWHSRYQDAHSTANFTEMPEAVAVAVLNAAPPDALAHIDLSPAQKEMMMAQAATAAPGQEA